MRKRVLVDTISGKEGGIKTLIKNYAYYFNKYATNFDFTFYVTPEVFESIKELESSTIKIKQKKFFSRNTYLRVLWELFILPFILLRFDCLFSMTHIFPFLTNNNGIMLIHQPNFFVKGYLKIPTYYEFLVKLSAHKANYIIVQTNFIAQNIVEKFKVNKNKVKIMPQGISYDFNNQNLSDNLDYYVTLFDELKAMNKIILLSVGLYSKHKNYEKLFSALSLLSEDCKNRIHLITTIQGNFFDSELKKIVIQNNLDDVVTNLDVINHKRLIYVYKHSDIFIFPSKLESLGLPVIEAMSFGLPILIVDMDYAHDVCADAAVYFDPNDEKAIAQTIENIYLNKVLLDDLSNKSNKRVKKFSWELHINEIITLLSNSNK